MAYKKRKRSDKYEEKLRIDGSFEEAMQALLGVHPKQLNMSNKSFSVTKKFNYKKPTSPDFNLTDKEMFEKFKDEYVIKVPNILASDLKIELELLSANKALAINSIASKIEKDIYQNPYRVSRNQITTFNRSHKLPVTFPKDEYDLVCQEILFFCLPFEMDAEIEVTISGK
jgi:hypothetical protein